MYYIVLYGLEGLASCPQSQEFGLDLHYSVLPVCIVGLSRTDRTLDQAVTIHYAGNVCSRGVPLGPYCGTREKLERVTDVYLGIAVHEARLLQSAGVSFFVKV